MRDGRQVTADVYVSAVPVDIMKRMCPAPWQRLPHFAQMSELEGIPVINLHLWFDRKLKVGRGWGWGWGSGWYRPAFDQRFLVSVGADRLDPCCGPS